MDNNQLNLIEMIDYIEPSGLDYQEWCAVGMALQHEGYPVSVWENWSRRDPDRYHAGECERKWRTFRGCASPVTGGTIVQMAKEHGWAPEKGRELAWDDTIQKDPAIIVDSHYIENLEIHEPKEWCPEKELITYIETLFGTDDIVGYVTRSWSKPKKKKK